MRPLGSLEDGTPYYAPLGQLPRDPQEDRVQCHLCGEWYRLVGGTHLSRTHGWTLADYRDAFRLPQQTPTCSPGLSQERRAQTLPRIGDGPFGVPPPAEAGERGRRTRAVARWRSLAANRPNLVAELHPTRNGELDPYRIGASSTRKLWWLCRACAHEWRASPAHRSRGRGCPSCARTRQGHRQGRVPRQRSLAAKHPELLAELHPTRNGELDPYQLPARSSRKIWWRCGGCGYAWQAVVGNRSNGSGCPRCGQRERARTLARVPRERSLAVKHPQLVAELHPSRNQDLDPYSLAPGSDRKIWWQCRECGHTWNAAPKGRTARGYGCPRCARRRRARRQARVAPERSLAASAPTCSKSCTRPGTATSTPSGWRQGRAASSGGAAHAAAASGAPSSATATEGPAAPAAAGQAARPNSAASRASARLPSNTRSCSKSWTRPATATSTRLSSAPARS